uniref:Queuosine 5'-phosphate N-glycosylase/hydrolase n=1 Tax=Haemonchus placei TaxID=6290 RepID=A0A0N4VUB4_HAEPC
LDITSAEWMAKATEADVDKVFKSDGGYSIPLLKERVKAINESGRVLLEKWHGSFYNCISKANGSAAKLLELIVENFESFRDFAIFCGQKVSFLKRAQILVADVYGALHTDDPACDFKDIGILTMFADYRVPQALAYLGALEYSPELVKLLKSGQLLPNGSAEEVELRGASIWVCEVWNSRLLSTVELITSIVSSTIGGHVFTTPSTIRFVFDWRLTPEDTLIPRSYRYSLQRIVSAIKKLRAGEGDVTRPVYAMDVDLFAWVYRRKHAAEIEKAKGIRNKIIETYPHIEPFLADILPKKENFKLIKCKDHVELLTDHNGVVQFLKTRNTEWVPTLRLLHKYPFIMPHQQVDKGAIKFVLNGSSIMCPGLTSPGAKMTPGVPANAVVAVMAEGKQHALAIGQMKMSSEEIQSVNKGIGIDNIHYLTDGLWRIAEKPIN